MIAFVLALSAAALPAAAQCVGQNLIAALPEAQRAEIAQRSAAMPYHRGLYWRARKGAAQITMIGTFHFDDPGHDAIVAALTPVIAEAETLLVEMGPEEEARMKARMEADPGLLVSLDGPTLPERLSQEDWQALSEALEARGVPAVMASRMRPWYAATILSLAPCMMRQMAEPDAEGGLDRQLMDVAQRENVALRALEPWDTVLTIFGGLTPQEEIDLIRYSLPSAAHADDYAVTMADAYADQDVWSVWEFVRLDAYRNSGLTRAEVDAMTAEAQDVLMDRRNRNWIAPLTDAAQDAAADGRAVVAAFGALHLPGENGVLRLLEREGWAIERLPL
ncbi:TraB/GumN family protein [Paracoccus isoporae]|nr:TraB/GumN family protein [Paracoccus isoporae]